MIIMHRHHTFAPPVLACDAAVGLSTWSYTADPCVQGTKDARMLSVVVLLMPISVGMCTTCIQADHRVVLM